MSDTVTRPATGTRATGRRGPTLATAIKAAIVVVLAVLPLYIDAGLLQIGLFTMAGPVGVVGLPQLSRTTGGVGCVA